MSALQTFRDGVHIRWKPLLRSACALIANIVCLALLLLALVEYKHDEIAKGCFHLLLGIWIRVPACVSREE